MTLILKAFESSPRAFKGISRFFITKLCRDHRTTFQTAEETRIESKSHFNQTIHTRDKKTTRDCISYTETIFLNLMIKAFLICGVFMQKRTQVVTVFIIHPPQRS